MCVLCYFFFFKQKTAYEMRISDWSSDVCSSDLHSRLPLHLIQTHRAAPTEEISVFFQGYVPARRREDGRCPSSLIKSRAFADRQWLGTRNNSYNGYSMAPAVGRYPENPPKGLAHEHATPPELPGRRCTNRRR